MSLSKETHRIITYNVLSSKLCGEDYFVKCNPKDLDPSTRLKRVISKLESEIQKGSIICLQEVSYDWCGALATLFQQNGYFLFTGLYGKLFNGNMGITLAFPTAKYKAITMTMRRLSHTKKWPSPPDQGILNKLWDSAHSWILAPVRYLSGYKEKKDEWDLAKSRENVFLFARLQTREGLGETLCIGNYHMPCMWRDPKVMTIHTALAGLLMQNLAKDDPYVLCGDFNFDPKSPQYQLVTTGALEQNHPEHPTLRDYDDWRPKLVRPFFSAYASFHGKEPEYTNNAQIKEEAPFIATLDYIFHSEDLQVTETVSLDYLKELKGPFPISTEPSDHVMIGAEFKKKDQRLLDYEKWTQPSPASV